MIEIVKTVYIVMVVIMLLKNNNTRCFGSKGDVRIVYGFERQILHRNKTKTFYEIEVGDYVKWVDTGRIDKVTKVTENIWGDKVYRTKELNGDKIGEAYGSSIELVI